MITVVGSSNAYIVDTWYCGHVDVGGGGGVE
jgi:hypothetical protein